MARSLTALTPPAAGTREAAAFDAALRRDPGYFVVRGLVGPELVDRLLRRLNIELVRHGLTPEQIAEWQLGTFFPHLRWEPEVYAVREPVERYVSPRPEEQWGDAQLLMKFPDEATEWPLTPHVDELPEWAGGRDYRLVAGVALTPNTTANGCLYVWPTSHDGGPGRDPVPVEMEPGDVIFMHPRLKHSGTLNRSGSIRYAVYFRLLTAP